MHIQMNAEHENHQKPFLWTHLRNADSKIRLAVFYTDTLI
jgi:hypothetical protein